MVSLRSKTYLITGASRGIGRAIALRLAADGANLVLAAKTVDDRGQKLKGTIGAVAEEVEACGGKALALQLDVRDDDRVASVIDEAVAHFGGLDGVINNAGAIMLQPVESMSVKRFDLLWQVNVRACYATAHHAIAPLRKADNPHIVNLSPPPNLVPKWFAQKTGYTITKFGMSMLTIGLAKELEEDGIAVNSLWPRTTIATAAVDWIGGEAVMKCSRTPEIMADAVHAIVTTPARELTGQTLLDEEILRSRGVTDFARYAYAPGNELLLDYYVEE